MIAPSQSAREIVQCFGPDGDVLGIRTEPSQGNAGTGILFLNAGVLHRIGPHRLHVTLARRLASFGLTSLRLDLSGIGDSRSVPGRLSFRESAVQDVRIAMDELVAECALRHFILFGLCSGADNALAAAEVDERISALILLDAPAYATPESRRRHRLQQLPDWRRVANWPRCAAVLLRIGVASLRIRQLRREHAVQDGEERSERKVPPHGEFEQLVSKLAARGTRILLVYTGVLGARYNAPDQFFEAFPSLRGKVDVEYFPEANHVFTLVAHRQALIEKVLAWTRAYTATRSKA